MKFFLITTISFLLSIQLYSQSLNLDTIQFDKLIESEKEIRNIGFINLYHYNGELYTGVAVEKRLTNNTFYQFKKGRKHGGTITYSKTKRKKLEWEYHKGMLRAKREWHMDGSLKLEVLFNRKSRVKKETFWYRNGEVKERVLHNSHSENRKVKRYSKKGKTTEKGRETSLESGKKVETKKVGKWLYFDRKGKRKKIEIYDQEGHLISSEKV